jgi:hypothetical protein
MKHTNQLRVLAGLLLAGALLAACADPNSGDTGAAAGGATTGPPTVPSSPLVTVPGSPLVTRPTPPAGGRLTVTGTIREGVEPGCMLLDAKPGGGRYLLVGGDRGELRVGARVKVTGRVDRNLLSTCQQGEPLVVASIQPIS